MHLISSKLKTQITLNGKLNKVKDKKLGAGKFQYVFKKDPVKVDDKHFQIMMAEEGSVLKYLLEKDDFIEHKLDKEDVGNMDINDMKSAVEFAQEELNKAMAEVEESKNKKDAVAKVKEAKKLLETAKKALKKFVKEP